MRVLVCGSRTWWDTVRVYGRLARLPSDTTIIHGDAVGADRIADEAANDLGFPVEKYPALWDKEGKKAGLIRTVRMLDTHPDLVIAFWDGSSPGTGYTIEQAARREIQIEVHR